MQFSIALSDVIALSAFILALYSTKKTNEFNKKQKESIEIIDRLNKLWLRKESEAALNEHKAEVSARFISLSKSDKRVKVFNKGKSVARNVRINFPHGNDLIIEADMHRKFPADLEPQDHIDLKATSALCASAKVTMQFIWDDATGINNKKTLDVVNT
ncbi:hypothetical protein [Vibrio cincinnatiensis]|uniref:hypothetical protein n=1 Tax=Vibrio cincinnatiensis TaxID=675 RepID=UPI001EDED017|nr:hypothetical protein [Vibrio cincinnatiensis]MCG3727481.1 hypothetical protein [Vibrio cincinnatiensis]